MAEKYKAPKRKADKIGRLIPFIGPLLIRERKKREDLNGPYLGAGKGYTTKKKRSTKK